MEKLERCKWVNLNNPIYVKYHDCEWGRPVHDDRLLFEMLILETFISGLSWEIVLNKRESFRKALDNFDFNKIALYNEDKINELLNNKDLIRHKLKIKSIIANAKSFIEVRNEFGSFNNYLWGFVNYQTIYEDDRKDSPLSIKISKDMKKRGFKFIGSVTVYSYLQAIGIYYGHEHGCFLEKKKI